METSYATISIGGAIKRSDIERFIAAAENDYAYPDDGRGLLGAALIDAKLDNTALVLIGEDVPWGEFDELEALCRELGLAYARRSDPNQGNWGEHTVFWQPGMREPETIATRDGEPVMTGSEIARRIGGGQSAAPLAAELVRLKRVIALEIPLTIVEDGPGRDTAAEAGA